MAPAVYSRVVPRLDQKPAESKTCEKLSRDQLPNRPMPWMSTSLAFWKASSTVHAMGSTTTTRTTRKVGETNASPARLARRLAVSGRRSGAGDRSPDGSVDRRLVSRRCGAPAGAVGMRDLRDVQAAGGY